jgi:NAD(P)-dependent dehydrogenase (short-subunit alcohol dehydrogenase family)
MHSRRERCAVDDHEVPSRGSASGLADKVVLITGGLGSATARTLLPRGAQVGIADLRPDTPEIAAGIRRPASSALPRTSATAPAVDEVLAVNINGVVNTVSAAMEQIIANQGQVVLISSVFAFLNGVGAIPHAMSKSAVEQLGRGLRVGLARHGASAYFSLIQTDMIRNGVGADPAITEMLARTSPRPLLKRLELDQAAEAVVQAIEHR